MRSRWNLGTWRWNRTLLAAVAAVSLMLSSEVATAGNWQSDGCRGSDEPCHVPSRDIRLSYALGPRMRAAVEMARTQHHNPQDINAILDSNGSNWTVKYLIDDTLPTGTLGRYRCDSLTPYGQCLKGTVRFRGASISGFSDRRLAQLACHEFGHSIGLWHPDKAGAANDSATSRSTYRCMAFGGDNVPESVGPYNADHINGRY